MNPNQPLPSLEDILQAGQAAMEELKGEYEANPGAFESDDDEIDGDEIAE